MYHKKWAQNTNQNIPKTQIQNWNSYLGSQNECKTKLKIIEFAKNKFPNWLENHFDKDFF